MRFGIGQPVTRKEDRRFLCGQGQFVADIGLARQTHAVFVYSPHAHARILGIDTAAAERAPGVHAVLTGAYWASAGMGCFEPEFMVEDVGGPKAVRTRIWPLAHERVRYVGERVAVVIADTETKARDAAELVSVDYEVLPAVVGIASALRPDAPPVHDDIGDNVSFTMSVGDAAATAQAFARAHHVTKLSLRNNRVTAVSMEPRGCVADFDRGTGRYTLYTSTQAVHGVRQTLARQILHVPENRIRVIARDVGGGFGMKGQTYPEEAVLTHAARLIGRPVKWIPSRTEALLGDNHARDQTVDAELALDVDGRFLALRWNGAHNAGAYVAAFGTIPSLYAVLLAPGAYDFPVVAVTNSFVFTNTAPTTPYRGAGRPEAIFIIERLVDQAARELRFDPAELRRRNLQPAAVAGGASSITSTTRVFSTSAWNCASIPMAN